MSEFMSCSSGSDVEIATDQSIDLSSVEMVSALVCCMQCSLLCAQCCLGYLSILLSLAASRPQLLSQHNKLQLGADCCSVPCLIIEGLSDLFAAAELQCVLCHCTRSRRNRQWSDPILMVCSGILLILANLPLLQFQQSVLLQAVLVSVYQPYCCAAAIRQFGFA